MKPWLRLLACTNPIEGSIRQRQYVRKGWNLPGDTFVMHADGYSNHQARSDDVIVPAGYEIAGPRSRRRGAPAPR